MQTRELQRALAAIAAAAAAAAAACDVVVAVDAAAIAAASAREQCEYKNGDSVLPLRFGDASRVSRFLLAPD